MQTVAALTPPLRVAEPTMSMEADAASHPPGPYENNMPPNETLAMVERRKTSQDGISIVQITVRERENCHRDHT